MATEKDRDYKKLYEESLSTIAELSEKNELLEKENLELRKHSNISVPILMKLADGKTYEIEPFMKKGGTFQDAKGNKRKLEDLESDQELLDYCNARKFSFLKPYKEDGTEIG